MKKKILALDIGNVCVKIDPQNCAEALGLTVLPEAIRGLCRDFEWGKAGEEDAVFARAVEILDNRFSAEKIKEAFNTILIEAVPGMSELVSSLPEMGVEAFFFSDISVTHLARTKELFPAFACVKGGVFSFETGAWKPAETMFETFESRYGKPDLYVDDRKELIEAAQKHGWNAAVFAGAEDLRKKLTALS